LYQAVPSATKACFLFPQALPAVPQANENNARKSIWRMRRTSQNYSSLLWRAPGCFQVSRVRLRALGKCGFPKSSSTMKLAQPPAMLTLVSQLLSFLFHLSHGLLPFFQGPPQLMTPPGSSPQSQSTAC
jgi:hypothetical protein